MKNVIRCVSCGSPEIHSGKCAHCGSVIKNDEQPVKKRKIKSDMGNFGTLENVILVGDMNNINFARNCEIRGDMNNITRHENTIVIGDMKNY